MKLDRVTAAASPKAVASKAPPHTPPAAEPKDQVVAGTTKANSAALLHKMTAAAGLRTPEFAVSLSNRFNAGLNLKTVDLRSKVALMCENPLKFLRCMPALYYRDLISGPYGHLASLSDRPAPTVQNCGDAHMGNFGVYRGADGSPVWGINDFDMTVKGPPSYDLCRLATATLLGMQGGHLLPTLADGSVDPKAAAAALQHLTKAYLAETQSIADGQYSGPGYLAAPETSGHIRHLIDKKTDVPRREWIKKFATPTQDGGWTFNDVPEEPDSGAEGKLVRMTDPQVRAAVMAGIEQYDSLQGATPSVQRPLHVYDVCLRRESGGSSRGQPRYYAMVANSKPDHPPVVLEIKQELPSPLVNWTGDVTKADSPAVVAGQQNMGCRANPLTGYTTVDGISYLVREREPEKGTLQDKAFATADDYASFLKQAGMALARAHARSPEQARKILTWAGDPPTFKARLADFGVAYARQTTADWQAFCLAHPEGAQTN